MPDLRIHGQPQQRQTVESACACSPENSKRAAVREKVSAAIANAGLRGELVELMGVEAAARDQQDRYSGAAPVEDLEANVRFNFDELLSGLSGRLGAYYEQEEELLNQDGSGFG